MTDWLKENFQSITYMGVFVISAVTTLILRFYSRLEKFGVRITKIETSMEENIKPRLNNLDQLSVKVQQLEIRIESFHQETEIAPLIENMKIVVQDIKMIINNSRTSEITPNVPIQELPAPNNLNSKKRLVSNRRKKKRI